MKSFACGDVVPDCQARFEGGSDAEILGRWPSTPRATTA